MQFLFPLAYRHTSGISSVLMTRSLQINFTGIEADLLSFSVIFWHGQPPVAALPHHKDVDFQ
jgi:hypothetical protein